MKIRLTQLDGKLPNIALVAAPFIKWAGGKRGVIPSIAPLFPEKIGTYYEPFLGGGAVFFTFADRIERAVLSDANKHLVLTYQIVKERVGELIELLKTHALNHAKHGKEYYLKIRAQEPEDALEVAARFIYLNKTCFNGLYRVNKSGKFNVPMGSYKNPAICDAESLQSASKVLKKATIKLGDFSRVVMPSVGDFVYCDPPYDDCFTDYQVGGFTADDQTRLRDEINTWIDAGADVMVSNSDTPLIQKLFRDAKFNVQKVKAPRYINAKASGRGDVSELIVTSYD